MARKIRRTRRRKTRGGRTWGEFFTGAPPDAGTPTVAQTADATVQGVTEKAKELVDAVAPANEQAKVVGVTPGAPNAAVGNFGGGKRKRRKTRRRR
jgi:hypothetical protein